MERCGLRDASVKSLERLKVAAADRATPTHGNNWSNWTKIAVGVNRH